MTTAAKLSSPWLAATAAAVRPVAPMKGTPAHEAATTRKSTMYSPPRAGQVHVTVERPGVLVSGASDPASRAMPTMAIKRPTTAAPEWPVPLLEIVSP